MPQTVDEISIRFEKLIRDNWGNPPIPPIDDDHGGRGGGDGDDEGPLSLHQIICLAIAVGAFLICLLTAWYVLVFPAVSYDTNHTSVNTSAMVYTR